MKVKLQNIGISLFSLLAAFFLSELVVRIADSREWVQIDKTLISDTNIYSATKVYEHKPYSSRVFTLGDYQNYMGINKYGFRDGDYSKDKPGNVFRIVTIGDSMTMGAGVNVSETYPKILESRLNSEGTDVTTYEVISMAVNGYGPLNYLAVYKENAINFNPDLTIVGVYLGNDARDTLAQNINQKFITLRAIPDTIVPYRLNQFLKQKSKLWLFTLQKYYSWAQGKDVSVKEVMFGGKEKEKAFFETHIEPSEDIQRSWLAIQDVMNSIDQSAQNRGTKVVFLGISTRNEIIPGAWKVLFSEGYKVDSRLYTDPYSRKQFIQICETKNFNCIDLQSSLRSHDNIEELFLGTDNHFGVDGHKVVADEILKYLRHQNLVE
jgi:hypothetical protein